jgi:uncharacterized protein (DUF3084 family)
LIPESTFSGQKKADAIKQLTMVKNNRIKALEHGRKVDEQMQPIHEKLQEMTEDHNKKLDQVNL